MKKFKNTLIVLLISFAMSFSVWPSMGYAQFFQPENSLDENQTETNLDKEDVEGQPTDNEGSEIENPQPEEPEIEQPQTYVKVIFRYLEEGTNKSITPDDEEYITEAGYYNFSETDAPEIEGYEFVGMNGDVSGTIEEGSNATLTVNMIYKAVEDEEEPQEPEEQDSEEDKFQVTYYYIDELTSKEISQREIIYLPVGSDVNSNVKSINNYVYHHTVQVAFCDSTVGVYNFYGRANPTGKYRIKINYLEEGTNKVLAKSFVSDLIENNFSYNVSCRDKLYIPGYKYVKTVGNVIGTINNKDVVINVYYRKVEQYRVTINFIDYILCCFYFIFLNIFVK